MTSGANSDLTYALIEDDDKQPEPIELDKVSPATGTFIEHEQTAEQIFAEKIDKLTRFLIVPSYFISVVIYAAFIIVSFVGVLPAVVAMAVILALTYIGSLTGSVGTYKYGTVEDCIDMFAAQNDDYSEAIDKLKDITGDLRVEADAVLSSVQGLKKESNELDETLAGFDAIRELLAERAQESEQIFELVTQMNKQCDDMREAIANNTRAHLLSIYYEVEFMDNDAGLSRREYQRFCGRLNIATRNVFEELGGFDAADTDKSGSIDLEEFQVMLEKVIDKTESEVLRASIER